MLINLAKNYCIMISISLTAWPTFPDLLVGGSIVKMVGELKILGVVIDSKLTFESHVRSVAATVCRRTGRGQERERECCSCYILALTFSLLRSQSPEIMQRIETANS